MSERIMYLGLLMSAHQLRDALTMIAKENDELNKEINRLDAIADTLEQQLKTARAELVTQVLDKPAKVGAGTFGVGIKWSTVISAAQRQYEYANNLEGK